MTTHCLMKIITFISEISHIRFRRRMCGSSTKNSAPPSFYDERDEKSVFFHWLAFIGFWLQRMYHLLCGLLYMFLVFTAEFCCCLRINKWVMLKPYNPQYTLEHIPPIQTQWDRSTPAMTRIYTVY